MLTYRKVKVDQHLTVHEEKTNKDIENVIRLRKAYSLEAADFDEAQNEDFELKERDHITLTSDVWDYKQYWIIEREDATAGGALSYNERFVIKNCMSGLYICKGGVLEETPDRSFSFVFPKPANLPEHSLVAYKRALIIQTSEQLSEATRKSVLVPDDKSREEDCMPLVVPTNHVSHTGDYHHFEVPAVITATNKDSNLELFEILPMKNDPEFMQRLARLTPKCSRGKQTLNNWIEDNEKKPVPEVEASAEKLVKTLNNFGHTLDTIAKMIRDSHTPEQYENKQCAVVGLDLHTILIDIAEIIFIRSQRTDSLAKSLYHRATKKAFQRIWDLLILVASENSVCCRLLEMHKERICTMVVREKKRIGQLLTEIYRVVDPDMPNYADDFAGWCRRLETLSENNIEEQTIFLNLIHCLCEVGENVKVEYQREIVSLLFDSDNSFPVIQIITGLGGMYFIRFYPRLSDDVQKLVGNNPQLRNDARYLAQGMYCVSLDELSKHSAYVNYFYTAIVLMNTLCKGPFEDGRDRVKQFVGITPELVLALIRLPSIHIKLLEACLLLADTLIASRARPSFAPVKDEDDQCYMCADFDSEDSTDFQERQIHARSGAINECIRQTVQFLRSRKISQKMESALFAEQLEYIQAVLSLTLSLLENGHFSLDETRKVYSVLGYFLIGLCGGSEAEELAGKHWAVALLSSNIKLSELGKTADLDLKLKINELFSILIRLLFTTNSVIARDKVQRLLAYCKSFKMYSPDTIRSLLKSGEGSMQRMSLQESELQQHLLSVQPQKQRQRKYPAVNHNMFRLVLNWSAIHPSLKETIISLLEQLFNENAYIHRSICISEVLSDSAHIAKYAELQALRDSLDIPAVLQETKRALLGTAQSPEIQELQRLYALVAKVADAMSPRLPCTEELPLETVQNIVRSVGLHKHFLQIFNFCTQFPLHFDLVHPQFFRLKIALATFYFYFVKDNKPNIESMLNLLQKHHYFVMIPRYCDFLRELGDFEHMTSMEHSRFYYYILFHCVGEGGGKIKLNGLYFLKAMMFDKRKIPIADRQNKIARYITELTREEHLSHVQDATVTGSLIELLALASIDNEPISVQCSSTLPLRLLEAMLLEREEPVMHHALLSFAFFVYGRSSKIERNVQKLTPTLLAVAKRTVSMLQPVFSHEVDLVSLGHSGKYEQIFPRSRPSSVEEGCALEPFDRDASLLRLLSSGSQWEVKGGVVNILPKMLHYMTASPECLQFCDQFLRLMEELLQYLQETQEKHQELYFGQLIDNVKESANAVNKLVANTKSIFGVSYFASFFSQKELAIHSPKSNMINRFSGYSSQLSSFFATFEEAINDESFADGYLKEMVKVFNSVSFGKDEIGEKVPKDKLESMTKVLRRIKKLFADTRHRCLYFEFLTEIVIEVETDEDLLRKYALNSIFKESRIISEAVNTLLRNEGRKEVIAVYDFLNKLLDRQNKLFMDEFRLMIDTSEKSYRLFYLIKTEMDFVKQQADQDITTPILTKLRDVDPSEEIAIELRQRALSKALMFLQLCCDNCNLEFQEYISSQKKHEGQASLDLVTEVAQFVIDITRAVGSALLTKPTLGELLTKALAALLDFVTGPCAKNQRTLGENNQIFIAISDLMNLTQNVVDSEVANNIHEKVMLFLHTLLEGEPPVSIYENMVAYLELKDMREGLENFYEVHVRARRDLFELERVEDDCLKQKLDIFILQAILLVKLKKMNETNIELKKFAFDSANPNSAYHFYAAYIGYVEIGKRDGQVQANYFPVPFKCKFLTPASRKSIIYDIDRSSHQKKIEEFVGWMPFANREMVHQQTLSAHKTLKSISSKWKVYAKLSFLVVLVINLQLLFSLEGSMEATNLNNPFAMLMVKISGVVQILLYIACVLFLVIEYYPAYFLREETYSSIEFDQYYRVPFNESQNTKNVHKKTKSGKFRPSAIELSLREIGTSLGLYYHYIYFLISILAIYDPLMYPFLLLDLIKQNEELVNVLKSITLNLRQLILTMIFGLIIIFLFSVYSFVFFQKDYSPDSNLYCGDLWNCFASTLNLGTRSGGGIGDALARPSEEYEVDRMIFDMLFFLVIIIIFLNIIFGIIIDTFAQLRDSRKQVLEDINNVCYICGTDRSVIDLHGKWSYHFMCEHSPLAYLAFLIYVTEKEMQDCSGIEKYVKEKLSKNDTSFMPTTFKSLQDKKSTL